MSDINLVDATDLVRWADRLDSRAQLPALVRRLVTATGSGLTGLSMRTGEGVQFPGWDGIVDAAEGELHVPEGLSVWEMGTDGRVAQKADTDYRKRTENPNGVDPSGTTFMFVTLRRWMGKGAWVAERLAEGVWKDVRVYDADDLGHWLERAPGVHAWLSAELGREQHEAESLETWWESWSTATAPPIPAVLLTSGRADAIERVRTHVLSGPSAHTIACDSQEEAVAFVAAALEGQGRPAGVLERSLIIRSPTAWRRLALSEQPLVLLPLFEGADVSLALRRGHHVIVAVGRGVSTEAAHTLPRLRRDGIESALKLAGLTEEKAARLATLGRRSLLSLRRTLGVSRGLQTPDWCRPENARDTLAALLAGSWVEVCAADREVLARLANRPYDEVATILTRWANTPDPPVRRVGDVWLVAAKQDAWSLLARYLLPDDVDRFKSIAVEVLGSDDPTFNLAPSERYLAPIYGSIRPHSSHLVSGLADTVALMGSVSDAVPLADGRRSGDAAASIVRELLGAANRDHSGRRWSSASGVLPALAEGAPDEFLSAVDRGLRGEVPLAGMFQDRAEAGLDFTFGVASPHTGLLWALESLAWNPDHLVSSTLALARLATIDPGGRLANRPMRSLGEILVLWVRGTAASIDERMPALDMIRRQTPQIAWPLLLRLIPSGHDSVGRPHAPTWRDWKPDEVGVLYGDVVRGVNAISKRVLSDAGTDGERWADVVARYAAFTQEQRTQIVEALRQLDKVALTDEGCRALVDRIREFAAHHREFAEANWALPLEEIDALEASCEHLHPVDLTLRYQWLFDQHSLSPFRSAGDYRQQYLALLNAQTEAVAEVYEERGTAGMFEWAERLHDPAGSQALGYAFGAHSITRDDEDVILAALGVEEELARWRFAAGFIGRRLALAGEDWQAWAQGVQARHLAWLPAHMASFLSLLPSMPEVWNLVESAGPEVDQAYWQRANQYGLHERGNACVRAARKLIDHDRPHIAVELLDIHADEIPGGPPDDLVAEALEESASSASSAPIGQMFTYHVGRNLDRLADHGFDAERLAALEWMYLAAFRYDERRSPILHSAISNTPEDFVAIVSMVYRAEGHEPRELTDADTARAMTARQLLDSWRDVPGALDDGTIDRDRLAWWVTDVRRLLADAGRLRSGEYHIGRVLRYGPQPEGDQWPSAAICAVIEDVASESLEDGLCTEIQNSRGVTTRGVTDGGAQERELVERYQRFARAAAGTWPRTAALLLRVARLYEEDARQQDMAAALTEDLWR